MHTTPTLATRFANTTRVLRSDTPLAEDQMRAAAPSVFAAGKHASRSERYTYIPTIDVLRGLQREGFEPFMVAQGISRIAGKSDYTKHMVRLRHAQDLRRGGGGAAARPDVNEVILINSHDGASSYRMLAGRFRFICLNGLVVGDVAHDIRIPHKGRIEDEVIEGAFRVLDDFEAVDVAVDAMKAIELKHEEELAFARAALVLRYGVRGEGQAPAPITAEQLTEARRPEDLGHDLFTALQRVQENCVRGGQPARTAAGRRTRSRQVHGIDRSISLNRGLWLLAEEMRRLKA